MTNLYPLKFKPILKERVWGGTKLHNIFQTDEHTANLGESWGLSGIQEDISLVSNGFLQGNDINDLTETYLGDLVGDTVYEKYGNEFPVLVKILDIKDSLSLQIHPDDKTAIERHNSYGKTECWYIMEAAPDAKIYLGLNKELTPREFYDRCMNNSIEKDLNIITPRAGDIIHIPPGTLHAATGGILVAEIQQVSDVTYRVYDWGREHKKETAREMHLDLAIDCINYKYLIPESLLYLEGECETEYFKVKKVKISTPNKKTTVDFDSCIIYFVADGEINIENVNENVSASKGEVVLIPAYLGEYTITGDSELLEITIKAP
jgi:mannose-6-phosphate isomerase